MLPVATLPPFPWSVIADENEELGGFIRLAGMEIELSEIVGRKADMRMAAELSPYFRQEVLDSAVIQYDKD